MTSRLLAAAAVVWVAALVFGAHLLMPVGAVICHQRPERSFFFHGHQMAVCARCTGLYAGAALAAPVAFLAGAALVPARARRLLLVAAIPTAVTWTLEFVGLVPFSNAARFMAGLPLGFVAAALVLKTLRDDRPASQA